MRVVLPLAGYGKRMRPQTWSKPKPLVSVAGKPILGHVLDTLQATSPDSYIFITGWLGDQVREYMATAHPELTTRYVVQEELRGQAHAIYLAKEWLEGPTLIVFVDTLFQGDMRGPIPGALALSWSKTTVSRALWKSRLQWSIARPSLAPIGYGMAKPWSELRRRSWPADAASGVSTISLTPCR